MPLSPPLKWAGGKRWLVPYLFPLWQTNATCRLVEPFCGGLGITLGLNPSQALLNDINPHLINFYRWLQMGLDSVILTPEENDEALYYARRDRFNDYVRANSHQTREAAVLFYYLNRTGFNGLCRFNREGLFNVPKGSYKHINYMSGADFAPYKIHLANWQFTTGDFSQLSIQPNDFIYADPPYDVPFTSYAQEDFTWSDQERLVKWLNNWSVPIILSNQATKRIVELYQDYGFELTFLDAPRRISSSGDRTPAPEVLAFKNISINVLQNRPQQKTLFTD
jgi:DNA adenine methylase